MKRMMLLLGLFASLVIGTTTSAQGPAIPVVPVAPVAAPAAPGNLWSFLLPSKDQCANVKTCFCNSAIGQMVNGLAGPFSLMSGGLIKNRCLQNSILNDLKKPGDTPEGAAARVAADAAAAKARRESVRALGLVDCNYWPEAIAVLATSLRGDRSECVRFEAALALRNGCCCNKTTVKALEMSVSGSNADGFPAERSDRVRAVAGEALAMCPIIETEIEKKTEKLTKNMLIPNVDPAEYYKKVAMMPNDQVVASARATLASVQKASKAQAEGTATSATIGGAATTAAPIHQRAGSLSGVVANAFGGNADPQTRMPFFTGLTRSLTGKQENAFQQFVVPTTTTTTTTRLPEIQTVTPTEISAPMPFGEAPTPPREKPTVAPEIVPTAEFMNPPREKNVAAPREAQSNSNPAPKSGSGYIQVSPHVRQLQPASKSKTPVELIPATPDLPATPTSSISPKVLPSTHIPAGAAPMPKVTVVNTPAPTVAAQTANFTVVNVPPTSSSRVPQARPASAPEIVQSPSGQPRQASGTVTIEIGER